MKNLHQQQSVAKRLPEQKKLEKEYKIQCARKAYW